MDKITETHIWAKKTISQKAQLQPSNGYAYAFKSVKKKKKLLLLSFLQKQIIHSKPILAMKH